MSSRRSAKPGSRNVHKLMLATPWCAVGLIAAPLAVRAARPVNTGAVGGALIPVLRDTGLTMLVWSVAMALALWLGV